MPSLADPPIADFLVRALIAGALAALICGVVGTWVVIRGMAFFGEAIGHGMLPGVAVATVLGLPVLLGGALSAVGMSGLIGLLQRRGQLSYDTSIGLLFVGMLSLGVIVVSHSRSFATDATVMLFGDILAVGGSEILVLAVTAMLIVTIAVAFHRSFVAVAFDERIARVLGLRPQLAKLLQVGLVTLAVVASYKAVGSLLVVGLLLAPAVAASPWTNRIPLRMGVAVAFGTAAVVLGLGVSWYASTAAGASIAASAILLACCSAAAHRLWRLLASVRAAHADRAQLLIDQKREKHS